MPYGIKRRLTGLVLAALTLALAGCGDKSAASGTSSAAPPVSVASRTPEKEAVFPVSSDTVRYLGRWLDDAQTGRTWFDWSCSGFSFTFTGTGLRAVLGTAGPYPAPHIAVYVDDEKEPRSRFTLAQASGEYVLAENLTEGPHTVRVMKVSALYYSGPFYAESITAVGENPVLAADSPAARRVEFIGDSITCGYGVLATAADAAYSSFQEDASRGFAYQTARALGADASLVCVSGDGVYCDLKGRQTDLLPDYYPYADSRIELDAGKTDPTAWDFSRFQPDAVVIHLGTNDAAAVLSTASVGGQTLDRDTKIEEFKQAYVAFLKQIRKHNPQATLFSVTGGVPCGLSAQIAAAVDAYQAQTGDTNIRFYSFQVNMNSVNNGISAGHPAERVHTVMAQELTAQIKHALGW